LEVSAPSLGGRAKKKHVFEHAHLCQNRVPDVSALWDSEYFSAKPGLQEARATRFQVIEFPRLYGAFSVIVDYQGTLFCLLRGMVTHIDQGLDHMVECIDIIIKEDDLIEILFHFINQEGFLQAFFRTHNERL
jgi:hypothetical protein